MSDFVVRPVEDFEQRASLDLFFGTLHISPPSEVMWEHLSRTFEPGRTLGAFTDQQMIGTANSWPSDLALPGGGTLPMAAVTGVGTRADHTRRGVLTELMRTQLADTAARGEPLAGLHASESMIYGRFGYGFATRIRHTRIGRAAARIRPDLPRAGQVRLLDRAEVLTVLPAAYERVLGSRPGMMSRSAGWWLVAYEARLKADEQLSVAVHTGPDGVDGFLTYAPQQERSRVRAGYDTRLQVRDLHAADPAVANDLWRFLLGIDLADEIFAPLRPLDEPVELMLGDHRMVRSEFDDELWLRLVDVPRALAGRTYGAAEPVVVEVRDALLPANSGRYRIGPHGTEPTTDPAGLAMNVDVLAMLYLGAWRASALATAGLTEADEPAMLPHPNRLFATDVPSWCGTMF
jgi:predicted acetyltransferase